MPKNIQEMIRVCKTGYDLRKLREMTDSELADFTARLRYGDLEKVDFTKPLFSYGCIARATKIPAHRLRWLLDRYVFGQDHRVKRYRLSAEDAA